MGKAAELFNDGRMPLGIIQKPGERFSVWRGHLGQQVSIQHHAAALNIRAFRMLQGQVKENPLNRSQLFIHTGFNTG